METIKDDRGIFGPDERNMMRKAGVVVIIPEPLTDPDAEMIALRDRSMQKTSSDVAPIDLDGELNFFPGEEPRHANIIAHVRALSEQITQTDATQDPNAVAQMAAKRADLTQMLPDVF
jgi:hypothetical protein